MRTVKIFKANRTLKDRPVESVTVVISTDLPPLPLKRGDVWDNHLKRFTKQGQLLAANLHAVLPGGTFDALLAAMLKLKASHFVVSFKRE